MFFLLVFGLASLGLAAYLVGEVATLPARQREGNLRRAAQYGRSRRAAAGPSQEGFRERAVEPMKMGLAHAVLKLSPRMSVDKVSRRLMGAGVGRAISPTSYLASKAIFAVLGFIGGTFLGGMTHNGTFGVLLALLLAFVGFMLPDLFVLFKARGRRDQIRSELPDALDLLAVSVEAGLGLDAPLTKLTEHMEGPLVDEFALTLGEIRIGESRQNALQKMVDRVQAPELAAFVRALIQAD